MPRARRARDA